MYIQPSGEIKIIKNCPLDSDYINTLYFADDTSRYNYFNSLVSVTLTSQTYVRVNENKIRASVNIGTLYNANYIMFKNEGYSNKWFYAFITNVEYVNNGRSDITYEIDVIQTYFNPSDLRECMVEREHSLTDNVGDNVINENIPLGDYVKELEFVTEQLPPVTTYIQFAVNKLGEVVTQYERGANTGNTYDGFTYAPVPVAEGETLREAVNKILNILEPAFSFIDIVSIINAPIPATSDYKDTVGTSVGLLHYPKITTGLLNGYAPKNNKLYTYPYNFVNFCGTNGTTLPIRFEYVTSDNVIMQYYGAISNEATFNFYLHNYELGQPIVSINMGVTGNYAGQMSYERIASTLAGVATNLLPQGDNNTHSNVQKTQRVYDTENPRKIAYKESETTEITTTNEREQVNYKGALNSIGGLVSFNYNSPQTSSITNGALYGTANLIYFEHNTQPAQILAQIDDYFDMFGYATMRVKTPNISSRPHWNYVKTQNSCVKSQCSMSDRNKINTIFDKGVTFWKSGSEIGNYNLNNKP